MAIAWSMYLLLGSLSAVLTQTLGGIITAPAALPQPTTPSLELSSITVSASIPLTTCDNTLCIDYFNPCGLKYGGCFAICPGLPTPTYTNPGCPANISRTFTKLPITTRTVSCGYKCVDRCGNTFGPGCYTSCSGQLSPSYTTPYCGLSVATTGLDVALTLL